MRAKDFIVEKVITEKNVPTNPSKWSYYKNQAKKKFDVYPSAYANAWAAKKYKAAGGKWKTESVQHNKPITELSVSGETTQNLEYYYNRYKDAKTPTEINILNAIRKELDRRNGRQNIAADKYTEGDVIDINKSQKDELEKALQSEYDFEQKVLGPMAMFWYKNNEDPAMEKKLADLGYEVGTDDSNGGVFVVKIGDENGDSYVSWSEEELGEAEQSPYAIGMAKAMKMYKDKPPLAKKTIKKAHEIAKAIQKD